MSTHRYLSVYRPMVELTQDQHILFWSKYLVKGGKCLEALGEGEQLKPELAHLASKTLSGRTPVECKRRAGTTEQVPSHS